MKKKILFITEIFIWLLLAGSLILLAANLGQGYFKSYPSYKVVFRDVDSLPVGAPVRMMGISVGYVKEVKALQDSVAVTFVITNPDIIIPKGSDVNIQFTGLAGSKSLEIEPVKIAKNSEGSELKVTEPIRLNSLMEVQDRISRSILDSCNNALAFFGHGSIPSIRENIKTVSTRTQEAIAKIDAASSAVAATDNVFDKAANDTKNFLRESDKKLGKFVMSVEKSAKGAQKNSKDYYNKKVKSMDAGKSFQSVKNEANVSIANLKKEIDSKGKTAKRTASKNGETLQDVIYNLPQNTMNFLIWMRDTYCNTGIWTWDIFNNKNKKKA